MYLVIDHFRTPGPHSSRFHLHFPLLHHTILIDWIWFLSLGIDDTTSGMSFIGTSARYSSRDSLPCRVISIWLVRSKAWLSDEINFWIGRWWLGGTSFKDMQFACVVRLVPSEKLATRALTPNDIKLFLRQLTQIVFLFIARETRIASSSLNLLLSSTKHLWVGCFLYIPKSWLPSKSLYYCGWDRYAQSPTIEWLAGFPDHSQCHIASCQWYSWSGAALMLWEDKNIWIHVHPITRKVEGQRFQTLTTNEDSDTTSSPQRFVLIK